MSENYGFNADFVLGEGLGSLSRRELLKLARELCRILAGEENCHGNIHPFNISRTSGGIIGLGPVAEHAPGDWGADEVEYIAPELFWERSAGPAADVYSIGMLLLTGVSGGRLPFVMAEGKPTASQRAAAVRRRLSGEELEIPPVAGEALGDIIRRCLAYSADERYSDPRELLRALDGCPDAEDGFGSIYNAPVILTAEAEDPEPSQAPEAEENLDESPEAQAEVPAGTEPPPVEPQRPAESAAPPVGDGPVYKVDKQFESHVPEKEKKSKKPVAIVLGICAALVILAVLVWALTRDGGKPVVPPDPSGTPDASTGLVVPTADPSASPSIEPTAPVSASPDPTAEVSPEPTPTPTPSPSPSPAAEHRYELFIEDVSWTEASVLCESKGGHLVTISDADELKKVTDLAEANGVRLVWIGLYRDTKGNLTWVTDEKIDFYQWGRGEPSVTDTDGTAEDYGLLWYWGNRTGWIYNDSRNDPVADFPDTYSGKIAYVCEYES